MTTEPREQQEPSMEEILSSIRRIIADEENDDGARGDELAAEAQSKALEEDAGSRAGDDQDDEEDVLELTRVVRESGDVIDLQGERAGAGDAALEEEVAAEVEARSDDRGVDLAPVEHGAQQERAGAVRETVQRKEQVVQSDHGRAAELMSATTASVAGGAFARLSQALQRTPEAESIADGSGRTVEQFVEDIARPLLKGWLDENLPAIVERLVQKEIQKISRRADLI